LVNSKVMDKLRTFYAELSGGREQAHKFLDARVAELGRINIIKIDDDPDEKGITRRVTYREVPKPREKPREEPEPYTGEINFSSISGVACDEF